MGVRIRISSSGQHSVEAECIQGSACEDAVRPYQQALGGDQDVETKPEYHEIPETEEEHEQERL